MRADIVRVWSVDMLRGVMVALMLAAFGGVAARADVTAADLTSDLGSDLGSNLAGAGARLYLQGETLDGAPARAVAAGGAQMLGRAMACATCHRRSGYGSVEGDEVVPPIAGPFLFTAGGDRARALELAGQTYGGGMADSRALRASAPGREKARPAYDDASLARALREGVDAAGEPLAAGMPRYELGEKDMAALIAYLRTLGVADAPGVDERALRLATVIAGDVPETRARAIVQVLQAVVADHNSQSRHDRLRSRKGPWFRDWQFGSYRDWELTVWRPVGAPESWGAQLAAAYDAAPVFAVLSGAAAGGWAPVHDFCEARALPCLFPLTDDPALKFEDWYTVYFSRGEALEADLALADLAEAGASGIVQVVASGAASAAGPARVAQAACGAVETVEGGAPAPDAGADTAVLLWLDGAELEAYLRRHAQALSGARGVYVFAGGADIPGLTPPAELRGALRVVQPFETRDPKARHLLRTTAWLRSRALPIVDVEAQADAYFAGMTTAMALTRMRGLFSREYLLERVEHLLDTALVTSIYPRLTLGPGQRFGSRGGYVLRYDAQGAAVRSEWRAPALEPMPCGG